MKCLFNIGKQLSFILISNCIGMYSVNQYFSWLRFVKSQKKLKYCTLSCTCTSWKSYLLPVHNTDIYVIKDFSVLIIAKGHIAKLHKRLISTGFMPSALNLWLTFILPLCILFFNPLYNIVFFNLFKCHEFINSVYTGYRWLYCLNLHTETFNRWEYLGNVIHNCNRSTCWHSEKCENCTVTRWRKQHYSCNNNGI